MKRNTLVLLWTLGMTCLLSTGCHQSADYEKSTVIQSAQSIQDSLIRKAPKQAEILLQQLRKEAKDSTEFYFVEAVCSSLLMTRQQADSAFYCIHRCENFCFGLKTLQKTHYVILGMVNNNKACLQEHCNLREEAKESYERSIQYYTKAGMYHSLPNIYNNLGFVYFTFNNLPMQAYCHQKALFLCDSLALPDIYKYNSYFMLGYCYVQLKNYPQAHAYLQKAMAQLDKLPLYNQYYLINTLVNCYYYQQNYEESWKYLMKIFGKVEKEKGEMPSEWATLQGNYADLAIKTGQNLKQAEIYLEQAKTFFEKTKSPISAYYLHILELELALRNNDLQKGGQLIAKLTEENIPHLPINYQQKFYDAQIEYYKRTGDYPKALSILEKKLPQEDSIRSAEHNNYVAELDLRYKNDTTHLHHRITIAQQENKIKVLHLESALAAVTILILIVYVLEYRRRIRKKRQQEFERHLYDISKLKMQSIREKISPHFLFNVLNNEISQHPEAAAEHQRLMQLTKLLRKGLDLSNRSAIPLTEELEFVSTYITLLQHTGKQFTFRLNKAEGTDEVRIPSMIIQIPVENAIKHGFTNPEKTGKLEITIQRFPSGIQISIYNDGEKYMPFASSNPIEGTGTGLRIIYQSIQLMNTHNKEKITFQIIPGEETGTTVTLFVPYHFSYEW